MAGGSVFGLTKGTWTVALGGTIFRDQGMESLCLLFKFVVSNF